ncbi:CHAT domain-containing protein [Nocardioides immobilis]|uniref:CHAT domain-containing protein n=1 Tax=Nocardioides immobilis TaxID=2049295 RepID=A0A417XSC5_9ACTN|nr:CHAT domain-containing protein [Nocardioides immobilis]RHW23349.1 CHAT domain-containing protein [Nocardioides immobilis]
MDDEGGGALAYLYVRGRLLVRDHALEVVSHACRDAGVQLDLLGRPLDGIVTLAVDADVPELLGRLEHHVSPNDVSPCHVACLTGFVMLGPAARPRPAPDWRRPPVIGRVTRAAGVVILDTGLVQEAAECPLLEGVTGDPDSPRGPFRGHGTFVAGVVRSVAGPGALHVTDTFEGAVVDEVTLARDLLEAQARTDAVVVVPGGFYTRGDRLPLTSTAGETVGGRAADPLTVCAAGNDATDRPLWPGAASDSVSVGALDVDGRHPAPWSNYGTSVDMWAVGTDVASTLDSGEQVPADPTAPTTTFAGVAVMSGTSVASAIAAGVVAAQLGRTGGATRAALESAIALTEAIPGLGVRLDPVSVGAPGGAWLRSDEAHLGFDPDDELLSYGTGPLDGWVQTGSGQLPESPHAGDPDVDGEPVDIVRTAFPLIVAPDDVLVGTEFEVTVGISPMQVAGVAGGAFRLPSQEVFTLTVQLVAEGFTLRADESWRNDLLVSAVERHATVTVHLTAKFQDRPIRATALQVTYASGGATLGWAVRAIAVVDRDALVGRSGVTRESSETRLELASPQETVGLTVNILLGDEPGRLLWTFESPHVDVPDTADSTNVGLDPRGFARQLILEVQQREGKRTMQTYLANRAADIAAKVPETFWRLLREVADAVAPTPPTVLLQSEDPYVPWELAWTGPALYPDRPLHLGCQATVGRWVVGRHGRPPEKPPLRTPADDMSVICGRYAGTSRRRLEHAEEEAGELTSTYGAADVSATLDRVLDCLQNDPAPQLLHFAGHGVVDDTGLENGLLLQDESTLAPVDVPLIAGTPHVFLNACEVGGGQDALGHYTGMAAAFLNAGAAVVVAPLWDVDDATAKVLVLEYYRRVLVNDERPADVVRDLRGRLDPPSGAGSGTGVTVPTALAYQFFGHPLIRLDKGPTTGGTR